MEEKIHVLHVVGQLDRGGTETLLMNMLRVLDRSRFQFDFVEQTQKLCDYDEEIEALGSRIYRCPTVYLKTLSGYRSWWREFFREHPEYRIVHGHSRGSAPIYLREANRAGRITIMHCHNVSFNEGRFPGPIRYIWQIPLRWIADYNFACSNNAGVAQFGRNGSFEIINNGIISELYSWNPESRAKARKELGLEDALVIGNVARIEKQKNHSFLLEIFKELKKKRPNSKLLLVGKGSKEEKIRAKAAEYGILEDIIFTGIREDVYLFYQAMDIFVFPSLYEGLGMVNIEAQTSGLPCFVSNTITPEAAVTDLVHFLPLSMPPEQWAEEILSNTVSEEERRDHRDEIIRAGYDIHSTVDKLCAFYTDVTRQ